MELAEFHAGTGLDFERICETLTASRLEAIVLERNPSAKSGLVRTFERMTQAGTDLAMIWLKPL